MTKYELVKSTNPNGSIFYHINRNGRYVDGSLTSNFNVAEGMLTDFENGKPSEPIYETLKTIEVEEGRND
jgi:hypothetical protein